MSIPRVLIIALGVCAFALFLLVAAGDAWAAPVLVEDAARGLLGGRALAVTFERWATSDVFTDADLRERSCDRYTPRKWRCEYRLTGYAKHAVPTYTERGWVKVKCAARRCVAFRLSVTHRTQPRLDRDLGAL